MFSIISPCSSQIQITSYDVKACICEKCVKTDKILNFYGHVKDLCKKANNKLTVLGRVTPYMGFVKKMLMNSSFISQLNYCPVTRMLHSRSNNNKIKYLHERYLQLALCKIPKTHQLSWCGNFVETNSFHKVSGDEILVSYAVLHNIVKTHLMNSYLKKIDRSLFTTKSYKHLEMRCLMSSNGIFVKRSES